MNWVFSFFFFSCHSTESFFFFERFEFAHGTTSRIKETRTTIIYICDRPSESEGHSIDSVQSKLTLIPPITGPCLSLPSPYRSQLGVTFPSFPGSSRASTSSPKNHNGTGGFLQPPHTSHEPTCSQFIATHMPYGVFLPVYPRICCQYLYSKKGRWKTFVYVYYSFTASESNG